jgi:peptide/nickel transport system permease protein
MKAHLIIGWLILIAVASITMFGEALAPHPARERHAVYIDGDTIITPPFPIATPGFALGSDQYGRDILSRLLVGTKPTMLTIVIVALLRLSIGCVAGILAVTAPYAVRMSVRLITAVFAALPAFVGALLVLTLSPNTTLGIFVVALTWNSWGDVAKEITYHLTQLQQQPYYHAAVSSGDQHLSIMVRHGGRLIGAQLQRLLLREMSAALTLLAMVGFLGYFVGGATWMIVAGDAVPIGARAADYPELGQLLATSFERVLRPEALITTATYIGCIIVGLQFLLIQPQGLPRRLPAWLHALRTDVEWWIARRAAVWLLMVLGGIGGFAYWLLTPTPVTVHADNRPAPVILQRVNPWGMYGGDASQSFRSADPYAPYQAVILHAPRALTSAPIVSARDDIYIYAGDTLLKWQEGSVTSITLPFSPIGNPAIDTSGNVVVVGAHGELLHIDSHGQVALQYRTTTRGQATSGAIIDAAGNVAVTVVDRIEFFDARGTAKWATVAIDGYNEFPPLLSPDGTIIVLANQAFDVADGGRLPLFAGNPSAQYEGAALISGADGFIYRRIGHSMTQLDVEEFVPTEIRTIDWDAAHVTMFFPQLSGVTIEGVAWQLYSGYGSRATFVWMYGQHQYHTTPLRAQSLLLTVGDDASAVFCTPYHIYARTPGGKNDVWEYAINPALGECLGGAFTDTFSVVAFTDALVWYASPETR